MLIGLILGLVLGIIVTLLIVSIKISNLITDLKIKNDTIEDLEKSFKYISNEYEKIKEVITSGQTKK